MDSDESPDQKPFSFAPYRTSRFRKWCRFKETESKAIGVFLKAPGHATDFEALFRAVCKSISSNKLHNLRDVRFLGRIGEFVGGWPQSLSEGELQGAVVQLGDLIDGRDVGIAQEAAAALVSFARNGLASDVVGVMRQRKIADAPTEVAKSLLNALRAAGQDAASTTVPNIVGAAEHHRDPTVRILACELVSQFGEDGARGIPALQRVLRSDHDNRVRLAAVRTLGTFWLNKLGSDETPLLFAAAEDPCDQVRLAAVETLATQSENSPKSLALLSSKIRELTKDEALQKLVTLLAKAGKKVRPLRLALIASPFPPTAADAVSVPACASSVSSAMIAGSGDLANARNPEECNGPTEVESLAFSAIRDLARKWPTFRRNLKFLRMYEDSGRKTRHSYAGIRDEYRKAHRNELSEIDKAARATVKKGIERARKALKEHRISLADALRALDEN